MYQDPYPFNWAKRGELAVQAEALKKIDDSATDYDRYMRSQMHWKEYPKMHRNLAKRQRRRERKFKRRAGKEQYREIRNYMAWVCEMEWVDHQIGSWR